MKNIVKLIIIFLSIISLVFGSTKNINVGNNTSLKGAVIASGSLDENGNFIDNKNLNLTSKTITYEDIKDKDKSNSYNVNLGYQNSQDQGQKSIELGLSTSNKEQTTYATIGQGDIDTSSNIENINRDVNHSQVITKDEDENLDIYLSNTSISKALSPKETVKEFQEQISNIGETISKEVSTNLPGGKELVETVKRVGTYIANYDKIQNIQETATNNELKIIQELDKLKEENPQRYKDTVTAIEEYNNALNQQQNISGETAFLPALVLSPLVVDLLISAGVVTATIVATNDARNDSIGGMLGEDWSENLPSFDKENINNNPITTPDTTGQNSGNTTGGFEAAPNTNTTNVGGLEGWEQNAGDNIIYANQSAKDAKKISSNNEANQFAQNLGYEDAHELKKEYIGKSEKNSNYDIYHNSKTGESFLINKNGTKIVPLN